MQVFTPDGTYLTQWGSEGAATGQFLDPIGIAVDSFGNVYVADTNNYRIQKFGNLPPACSHAAADPAQIWPPNHQLVLVAITGVTDPDGDPVTITVTDVTQNEPLSGEGDGNSCPDAVVANGAAQVRAERSGGGNGRVYTISFAASDGQGGTCNGSVAVCVPHDLGQDGPGDRLDLPALHRGDPGAPRRPSRPRDEQVCVDDGQRFNSLGPCPAPRDIGAQALTNVTLRVGSRRGNTVTLEYSLPTASDVTIALYDIAGRRMTTLLNGSQDQGMHQLSWNSGSLKRGMYFIRLQAGAVVVTKSILVL